MIRIVTGPPASGKTQFVKLNAKPGDIVVDMDAIAHSLWVPDTTVLHDYPADVREVARSARNAAAKRALQVAQGKRYLTVWIIHSDPDLRTRQAYIAAGAKFTHIDPGLDVCLQRVKERGPRVARYMESVIREYYARRPVR